MAESTHYMKPTSGKRSFAWRDIVPLAKDCYKRFMASEPFQLSAIVAYYAILSLPALVVIILNIVGSIWGRELVQGELTAEISQAIGPDAAASVMDMMKDRGDQKTSIITAVIGIVVLLYGATGVFFQLQQALDKIWGVSSSENDGILNIIKSRAKGFGFILIIGFLMLVSFLATTLLSAFSKRLSYYFPESWVDAAFIIDITVSLFMIYILFASLFKFLPSVQITWRAVRVGAAITALLFVLGKYALAYYFASAEPGSTYGASGSIILVMLWVSYSSLILFFGATFTKVYADKYINEEPQIRSTIGFINRKVFKN